MFYDACFMQFSVANFVIENSVLVLVDVQTMANLLCNVNFSIRIDDCC